MLFISVFTFEPGNRDAILQKRAKGLFAPEGAKCLGQWISTSGGRAFTLCEVNDSMTMYQWCHAWSDLGKFDIYPVVDADELLKALAAAP